MTSRLCTPIAWLLLPCTPSGRPTGSGPSEWSQTCRFPGGCGAGSWLLSTGSPEGAVPGVGGFTWPEESGSGWPRSLSLWSQTMGSESSSDSAVPGPTQCGLLHPHRPAGEEGYQPPTPGHGVQATETQRNPASRGDGDTNSVSPQACSLGAGSACGEHLEGECRHQWCPPSAPLRPALLSPLRPVPQWRLLHRWHQHSLLRLPAWLPGALL